MSGTKRTNIMLEFSSDVYSAVVEPMKKNKRLSKVIATLLTGYLNDGYIRAYADDNVEDLRRAAVDSFSASVDSMTESLANTGLFTDELESISKGGKSKFKEVAQKESENISNEEVSTRNVPDKNIDDLNDRLDKMEKSLDDRFNQMFELMQNIVNSGNVLSSQNEDESKINGTNFVENNQTYSSQDVKKSVENVEKSERVLSDGDFGGDTEEGVDLSISVEEANDFMSSMLDGNLFSF